MFNRNYTALVALFIFSVLSFRSLSHAQLNSVTVGNTSDFRTNWYQTPPDSHIQSGGVWYDSPMNANSILAPTATTSFASVKPICKGSVLLKFPTKSNNGFKGN